MKEKKGSHRWYANFKMGRESNADEFTPKNRFLSLGFYSERSLRMRERFNRDFGIYTVPEEDIYCKEQLSMSIRGYEEAKHTYETTSKQLKKENEEMNRRLSKLDSCKTCESPSGDKVIMMSNDDYNEIMQYKQAGDTESVCISQQAVVSPIKKEIDEWSVKDELIRIFGKHGENKPKYYWRAVLDVFNENRWGNKKITLDIWAEWVNSFIEYPESGENPLQQENIKYGKETNTQLYGDFKGYIESIFFGYKIEQTNSRGKVTHFTYEKEDQWRKDKKKITHAIK